MKIGVYDSGVGGMTVLEALIQRFPEADFLYYGDTANVPYGTKSAAQVVRLAKQCAEALRQAQVDYLVVACNTASALALNEMREVLGQTPVLGVVEPGVQAILDARISPVAATDSRILILATRATIKSQAYRVALQRNQIRPELILEQACPLLVPLIEEGWVDHPILHQTLAEYCAPYQSLPPGIALLGCTHYPWILSAVEKALPGWRVIHSAHAVATTLEKEISTETPPRRSRKIEWRFTDDDAVPLFAARMMRSFN